MALDSPLISQLKSNPFVLAPMAGITDHPFRTLMKTLGSSIVVSELISANGIEYENAKTLEMMGFDEIQRPVAIQLFGEEPEVLARAAQVVESKNVDFIDINFGCPVPKVTKKGGGSAVLKDLTKLTQIVRAVVKAVKIPVTIKIRTGWDHLSRNSVEVCHIAYNEGVTWVAIHGRTRAQNYEGFADWDYIADVKSKVKIPILGNGDIHSAKEANFRLTTSACDGVLIGRGALKNPFIFKESLEIWRSNENHLSTLSTSLSTFTFTPSPSLLTSPTVARDYSHVLNELNRLYSLHSTDQIRAIQLKKFAAWFSSGFPESAKFRKNIFQLNSNELILEAALLYFSDHKHFIPEDSNNDKFLMGGHG